MKRILAAIALGTLPVVALAVPALAQLPAAMELGPKVGAAIPAINVVDVAGAPHSARSLMGKSGVTLVFYRSADWCPFCKLQLKNLNEVAKDMEAAGWPMVGVSYDPAPTLAAFSTTNALTYPLMTDPKSAAIDALGIRNASTKGSARFDGIPHPIILFVGKDGTVKAKLYEEAYQKRPASALVLETAKGLK